MYMWKTTVGGRRVSLCLRFIGVAFNTSQPASSTSGETLKEIVQRCVASMTQNLKTRMMTQRVEMNTQRATERAELECIELMRELRWRHRWLRWTQGYIEQPGRGRHRLQVLGKTLVENVFRLHSRQPKNYLQSTGNHWKYLWLVIWASF